VLSARLSTICATRRKRRMRRFVLTAVVAVLLSALAGTATAAAKGGTDDGFPPSVKRFNLNGYVLQTSYTLGRNKGNTVQGVPVKGPAVGMTFPPVDYVALQVASHTLYVAWLDPTSHAIVDAF